VKGSIYVGWVVGCRTAKLCESAGHFYFVCVRLMPQNHRNLRYFSCVVCPHPLSIFILFHNGSSQTFPSILVLPVGGMVLYSVVRLRMVRLERPETSRTELLTV
jgi:hypothetical protein